MESAGGAVDRVSIFEEHKEDKGTAHHGTHTKQHAYVTCAGKLPVLNMKTIRRLG